MAQSKAGLAGEGKGKEAYTEDAVPEMPTHGASLSHRESTTTVQVVDNVTHLHTDIPSRQRDQAALATQNARVDLPSLAAALPRLPRLATPPPASASVAPSLVPPSTLGTVLSSTTQQRASQPTVDKPALPSSSSSPSPSRAVRLGQTPTGAGCKLTYSAM